MYVKTKVSDWVEGFSKLDIKGRSLESFFSLDGQFSYYWPSLISEKSYLKSPTIYQLFQLLALEEVLNQYQPTKILLVSSDRKLSAIISQLVSNIECQFIFRRQKVVSKKNNVIHHLKKVFYSLPYF